MTALFFPANNFFSLKIIIFFLRNVSLVIENTLLPHIERDVLIISLFDIVIRPRIVKPKLTKRFSPSKVAGEFHKSLNGEICFSLHLRKNKFS